MHKIEPYYRWLPYYDSSMDDYSPFHGKEYNYDQYSENIYGYYIDPAWDFMGSETLYLKILYIDYDEGYSVIEFIGEWNDAINNDIMHLKRNIIEHMQANGINKFILIGENVLNYHGSDDCYYEEWFDEVDDGWIVGINFPEHITSEWKNYNVDSFIIFGGELDVQNWRTMTPAALFKRISGIVSKRIDLI